MLSNKPAHNPFSSTGRTWPAPCRSLKNIKIKSIFGLKSFFFVLPKVCYAISQLTWQVLPFEMKKKTFRRCKNIPWNLLKCYNIDLIDLNFLIFLSFSNCTSFCYVSAHKPWCNILVTNCSRSKKQQWDKQWLFDQLQCSVSSAALSINDKKIWKDILHYLCCWVLQSHFSKL